ncbi:hypothetical protein CHL67_02040 [Prosthecochloris sp. GSB1]|uniref:hypothetical protein n=1 Tax=Prosthecochloris sp. GSB1 TaxID=281093 RepID=UPI000B8CD796|nr:hypothetical protein [Prosthecochloris sp. GSB1]ASQ89861.1 hypothetical protein CHL67_02040 [Prosthecochloris sp. GSB1]
MDTKSGLLSFIREVVSDYAAEMRDLSRPEVYLVDVLIKGAGSRRKIEVLVDTDQGIAISQCVELNRRLLDALEADAERKTLAGEECEMTVSSPGIGGRIKNPRQYLRHTGRLLRVRFAVEDDRQQEIRGRLLRAEVGCDEPFIVLEPSKSGRKKGGERIEPLSVGLDRIIEAVVEVEF